MNNKKIDLKLIYIFYIYINMDIDDEKSITKSEGSEYESDDNETLNDKDSDNETINDTDDNETINDIEENANQETMSETGSINLSDDDDD